MAPPWLSASRAPLTDSDDRLALGRAANHPGRPWGLVDELVARGVIAAEGGLLAMRTAQRSALPVEDILISRRLTTPRQVAKAQATIHGAQFADLELYPPDGRLVDAFGADRAIREHVLPAYDRLSEAAGELAGAAASCDADATRVRSVT